MTWMIEVSGESDDRPRVKEKGKPIHNEDGIPQTLEPVPLNRRLRKLVFLSVFILLASTVYFFFRSYLGLEKIASAESALRELYRNKPVLFVSVAFFIYVVATGLSLPISTLLSLIYAWLMGWAAIPVLNLASTCGATLAFLSSRFVFHDWVQQRFADRLVAINRGFERDGAFYIIAIRMIAVFPYFVVNLVLGLVPVRTWTYFWATMVGMLPLNCAFVYLGMQIPTADEFVRNGASSLLSGQLLAGVALIGVLPLILRAIWRQWLTDARIGAEDP